MPSSSSHTTLQESSLHSCWRHAYIRLRALGREAEVLADLVTHYFSETLDLEYGDLESCYWPPGPAGEKRETAKEERIMHEKIEAQGWKLSEVEKVEEAANAVMSAMEVLVRSGREVEGEDMARMGKMLHEIAEDIPRRLNEYSKQKCWDSEEDYEDA